MLAAAEHQVFEKMRETRFAGLLVFRADVIPDVYGDDRCFVIFVDDHCEAVFEDEFLEGDVNVGGSLRQQTERENAACGERQNEN